MLYSSLLGYVWHITSVLFFLSCKRRGDNHEGKVDDVQHIFRQVSFLKERKRSIRHTATEKALHIL